VTSCEGRPWKFADAMKVTPCTKFLVENVGLPNIFEFLGSRTLKVSVDVSVRQGTG